MDFKEIINSFDLKYDNFSIETIQGGNINSTFLVKTNYHGKPDEYVLQRINSQVFGAPLAIMDNIEVVLNHLDSKILYYIKSKDGKSYFIDKEGNYWRIYNYVQNSISYSSTDNYDLIYETGKAFGNFLLQVKDVNANLINETIPNFHNLVIRYNSLEKAKNSYRFDEVKDEYLFLLSLKKKACYMQSEFSKGKLQHRIVHNDAKCSNVLFDRNTLKYLAVVDLDTVMPGLIAYDFGDGARSICASKGEESNEFNKIYFCLDKFEQFSKGFLTELKDYLTINEKHTMHLGVFTLTCELAIRFLTDYLMGDCYFKINYPTNNKIRALNQIALLKDIIKKENQIKLITNKFL